MERRFLSQKGGGGGKGVNGKQHTLTNDVVKDNVVVSSPVVATRNIKDVNVGQTPINSIVNPNSRLFFFQFSSMDGLNSKLENGLCFIRNNPFIIKKWDLDVNLLKEDVLNVLIWIKLHGVHVTTFSDDGLSVITTKLGTPLMLDSYTYDMYMQSWGRSSFARAMIELRADVELKDTIVVAMPKLVAKGFYTYNIHVEYE
ncbi:reverse transcriptase domain-containing protein [Tanacetum coccineum]